MKIAPSLLSCDFSKMGEEIERMDLAGADWMHLDVMDGHFVPNITFGAPVIKAVRKFSNRPFDVHLMISDPLKYIDDFADAGADIITFHVECDSDIDDTIAKIKSRGIKPGLVLKPNTPAWTVFPYLEKLDLVLVMTVEPGFGGQSFMPEVLDKCRIIRREINQKKLKLHIEIDGGIDEHTVHAAAEAGANMMVAGTAVFRHKEGAETAIQRLHAARPGEIF